jgi:hypothetical protein
VGFIVHPEPSALAVVLVSAGEQRRATAHLDRDGRRVARDPSHIRLVARPSLAHQLTMNPCCCGYALPRYAASDFPYDRQQ